MTASVPDTEDSPAQHERALWNESANDENRLRRAEKDIRWMRNFGLVGWLAVLYGHGYEFGLTPVWGVYFGGVAYAVWMHHRAETTRNIRRAAVTTTFGDPILAALICLFTGGIDAILYPFFYFTQMSVAIRFGVRESLGIALFNCALTMLIYLVEPIYTGEGTLAPALMLLTKIFLLCFAGFMGAIIAGWARQHAMLILEHARTLRESGERYQAVLRRFAQVQEEERRNISGELHDRMSGHLFGLRQGLEQCNHGDVQKHVLREKLEELEATVSACTQDVRSIMNELRPTVLDELGFVEAASEYLGRQAELLPFKLRSRMDSSLRDWRSTQDAMLFRLLQEALLNVQKHANASLVEVVLQPQGKHVVLTITDDGDGFDPGQIPLGHYGLMTMRERAEAAGGELYIHSGPTRQGTRVEVRMPRGKL